MYIVLMNDATNNDLETITLYALLSFVDHVHDSDPDDNDNNEIAHLLVAAADVDDVAIIVFDYFLDPANLDMLDADSHFAPILTAAHSRLY
tara:strand:- start:202 stop:474 length:273 start_codon:yes stop_codon:yes gene_type:complete